MENNVPAGEVRFIQIAYGESFGDEYEPGHAALYGLTQGGVVYRKDVGGWYRLDMTDGGRL